jgi:transcriptional regulator with XRE-family HTH domain
LIDGCGKLVVKKTDGIPMGQLTPGCAELVEFGNLVRTARDKKGVSLRHAASEVGMSPTHYSKIERGEAVASADKYTEVCRFLDLEPTELLPSLGMIDSETQKMIEQMYREDAIGLQGHLRKFRTDKE